MSEDSTVRRELLEEVSPKLLSWKECLVVERATQRARASRMPSWYAHLELLEDLLLEQGISRAR